MPFEITTTRTFSAAHALRLYDGTMEPVHGHNWRVVVGVAADALDEIGVVMDFHDLERRVDAVIGAWHNSHLNEQPDFAACNPSAEGVALRLGQKLQLPANVRLVTVAVWETDTNCAVYRV